jgi:hypothetical protein
MSGRPHYVPRFRFAKWLDAKLPLPTLIHDQFVVFPTPRNRRLAGIRCRPAHHARRQLRLADPQGIRIPRASTSEAPKTPYRLSPLHEDRDGSDPLPETIRVRVSPEAT